MTSEEIFAQVKEVIAKNFEIDPNEITMESNIVTDLDLDSIDAIDMLTSLQRNLSIRLTPSDFKSVKTIKDIVDVIQKNVA